MGLVGVAFDALRTARTSPAQPLPASELSLIRSDVSQALPLPLGDGLDGRLIPPARLMFFSSLLTRPGIRNRRCAQLSVGSRRYPHIRPAGAAGVPAGGGRRLSLVARAWRPAPGAAGLRQYRLAQCILSRLCRLHGHPAVSRAQGLAALLELGRRQPLRAHVFGGAMVALPPRADLLTRSVFAASTWQHIVDSNHTVLQPMPAPARVIDGKLSYVAAILHSIRCPESSLRAYFATMHSPAAKTSRRIIAAPLRTAGALYGCGHR